MRFPADLDCDAAGVGGHAGAKGVSNDFAATWDVYSNLQRRCLASGGWAGGQGAQCHELVPHLVDGDWTDSA
jgi:hypothetical protein